MKYAHTVIKVTFDELSRNDDWNSCAKLTEKPFWLFNLIVSEMWNFDFLHFFGLEHFNSSTICDLGIGGEWMNCSIKKDLGGANKYRCSSNDSANPTLLAKTSFFSAGQNVLINLLGSCLGLSLLLSFSHILKVVRPFLHLVFLIWTWIWLYRKSC